jgi:hypothetical protein
VHQLFIDFKKAYKSVKREVLYNILLQFAVPKKLVRLIIMCLNETYSKVRAGNFFLINFLFRMLRGMEVDGTGSSVLAVPLLLLLKMNMKQKIFKFRNRDSR